MAHTTQEQQQHAATQAVPEGHHQQQQLRLLQEPLLLPLAHDARDGDAGAHRKRGRRAGVRRCAVALFILASAALLSWAVPVGKHLPCPFCVVSSMIGWTYFMMWTVSFYPQLLTNFKRRSVEGLSLDFALLNVLGFACYSAYNLALVYSPRVREEYQARFGTVGQPVELNDLFFGLHALALSLALAVQCCVFPRGAQRVSRGCLVGVAAAVAAGAAFAGFLLLHGEGGQGAITGEDVAGAGVGRWLRWLLDGSLWTWLDLAYYCSFVKMAVTLVKYVPQLHMNRTRRSTQGWSIDNVLLDLGGGLLSLAQLLVSCEVLQDWSAVVGNPVKFALGLSSIVFDVLFMLQHWCWYPAARRGAAGGDGSDGSGSYARVHYLDADAAAALLSPEKLAAAVGGADGGVGGLVVVVLPPPSAAAAPPQQQQQQRHTH